MKRATLAGLIAGFAFSPAMAGDFEAFCVEYTTANGGDSSGCSCLAEASDDTMAAEMMAIESDSDIEALSDASKEAIASCFPDSGGDA